VAVPVALGAPREIVRGPAAAQAPERSLPVTPALAALLPAGGLRRGTTVAVEGSTSLLLMLLAEPSRAGAWCAVVGHPTLGVVAAAEAGIALDRLVLVPDPGPRWPVVVAALIDALDVVVVRQPREVEAARTTGAHGAQRRLVARARERGCLLVPVSGEWGGVDLRLSAGGRTFAGLGQGHGHLRGCRLLVTVSGRGSAARPRSAWLTVTGDATSADRPVTTAAARSACGPQAGPREGMTDGPREGSDGRRGELTAAAAAPGEVVRRPGRPGSPLRAVEGVA
jgi:hypothetical protein